MSEKLLIFGGTTEGRILCEALSQAGRTASVCTATVYGGDLLEGLPHITVYSQRLNSSEMQEFIRAGAFNKVLDATHPYACEVTLNIKAACAEAGAEYIRVLRAELGQDAAFAAKIRTLPNAAAVVQYLSGGSGRVLLTTGSKDLAAFCALPSYQERLVARVLPDDEVIRHCKSLGLFGAQIIAMQGPFSQALNLALLRHFNCRYLVTKNTGSLGGLENKIGAALEAGAELIMLARPLQETGYTLAGTLKLLGVVNG